MCFFVKACDFIIIINDQMLLFRDQCEWYHQMEGYKWSNYGSRWVYKNQLVSIISKLNVFTGTLKLTLCTVSKTE